MSQYVLLNRNCPECGDLLIYDNSSPSSIFCERCGYMDFDDKSINAANDYVTNTLVNKPENNVGGLYGWICPKCGAVMSPYTSFCPNCTQSNFNITYTTGGSNL